MLQSAPPHDPQAPFPHIRQGEPPAEPAQGNFTTAGEINKELAVPPVPQASLPLVRKGQPQQGESAPPPTKAGEINKE